MTAFERFFAEDFPARLRTVPDEKLFSCPSTGLASASWDRRAAFLLWEALGRPDAAPTFDDDDFI